MGVDKLAVVEPDLRGHGKLGLRVTDGFRDATDHYWPGDKPST
jgi:hypothetical protein